MKLLRNEPTNSASWKNGGGSTREVAAYPAGAGIDDFLWRVSVAEIGRPAEFSHFSGIDRQLMLLQGSGIELRLPQRLHRLSEAFETVQFAGETPVYAAPLAGSCLALNVMARRGRSHAALAVIRGSHQSTEAAGPRVYFVAQGRFRAEGAGGGPVELGQHDAIAVTGGATGLRFSAAEDAVLVEIEFRS